MHFINYLNTLYNHFRTSKFKSGKNTPIKIIHLDNNSDNKLIYERDISLLLSLDDEEKTYPNKLETRCVKDSIVIITEKYQQDNKHLISLFTVYKNLDEKEKIIVLKNELLTIKCDPFASEFRNAIGYKSKYNMNSKEGKLIYYRYKNLSIRRNLSFFIKELLNQHF